MIFPMRSKFSSNQIAVIIAVPVAILVISLAAYHFFGLPSLIVPPVLVALFLAWSLVEFRHYVLRLFTRQTEESRMMFAQLEALIGITRTLDPALPLPPTRGWSASPDLLREIMDHVINERPGVVVEASSGTSTLVIAYCLRRIGKGRLISLEHDPKYAARTRRALRSHDLQAHAEVIDAPLVKRSIGGNECLWYDTSALRLEEPIDLLVVDGPPDTISKYARYPAVPVLRERFRPGTTVLLDDGVRDDERITAERWAREFGASEMEYLPLEKGAWLLRF